MKITMIGHAGLLIETGGKKIVCDPWFSERGAFLCSWHQWPRNDRLGGEIMKNVMSADMLFVSHLHRDHFDEEFLRGYFAVNPDVEVLVPEYREPNILGKELAKLGAKCLTFMEDGDEVRYDGFSIETLIDWDGTYAEKGDSALCVSDSSGRVLNQNDAKIQEFPQDIDVHFAQFSGAIWYPMSYRVGMGDEPRYAEIIEGEVRRREVAFAETAKRSHAKHMFPHAGPPVFLRDSQRWLNEPGNSIFYDQPELLHYLRGQGVSSVHVTFPGMVIELRDRNTTITYPNGMSEQEVEAYFEPQNKAKEIALYAEDRRQVIESFNEALPAPSTDLRDRLIEWINPILGVKVELLDKIGGNIMIESDDREVQVLIDVGSHTIRILEGDIGYDHSFTIPRRILELMVLKKERVWTSEVFLGVVHQAWRRGGYNRYVYDLLAQLALPPSPKT